MLKLNEFVEQMGQIREPDEEGISAAGKGFNTAMLTFLSCPPELDCNKALHLALVYNLGSAAEEINNTVSNNRIKDLYNEAHNSESPEADFVRWINQEEGTENYPSASLYVKKNGSAIYNLLTQMHNLKRSGWVMREVEAPESDAEHSYGVALTALTLAEEPINLNRMVRIALIHDTQEIFAGDFTPHDKISSEAKALIELEAAKKLSKQLHNPEMLELFMEYELGKSAEARMVKDIDRADAVLLGQYYDNHKRAPQLLTPEFLPYAMKKYTGGYGNNIIEDMYKQLKIPDNQRLECVSNIVTSLQSTGINRS